MMDENKPFACDICEKSFKQKAYLTTHRRIHTGEKPYECDICKKFFSHNNTLVMHMRVHKNTFSDSINLTQHKRLHIGEKPYSCDVCQKSYTRGFALSEHDKTTAHIKRMKSKKSYILLTQTSFVDCGEYIKLEDIKEKESVEDPLNFPLKIEKCVACDNIKKEINEDRGEC